MNSPNSLVAALLRRHLIPFTIKVFETLEPSRGVLEPSRYLEAMAYALERVAAGETTRLVISVPPRHLKSIMASVAFVAWMLGRDPALRIMVATYNQDLARKHADSTRMIMESDWYRREFPKTRIKEGGNRQLEFVTTANGGRKAVSVGGPVTGFGADIIILDDINKADDAFSPAAKEEARLFFDNTLFSRLEDKERGAIVSIQQRLAEDDLPAYLLEKGYDHLCLPTIAENDHRVPIGPDSYYYRKAGSLLDHPLHGAGALAKIRKDISPHSFGSQYQQNPVLPGGNLIKLEWFGRVDELPERSACTKCVQSWDTASSTEPNAAWSVCTTWGYQLGRWYLLDVFRERLEYPDLKRAVLRLQKRWRPDKVVIEDASSGISLWQDLRSDLRKGIRHGFTPIMYPPTDGKEERLIGQTGQLEAGICVLPNEAPWLDTFVAEARAFPACKYFDQVDSMTQFLEFIMWQSAWVITEYNPETGRRMKVSRRATVERR